MVNNTPRSLYPPGINNASTHSVVSWIGPKPLWTFRGTEKFLDPVGTLDFPAGMNWSLEQTTLSRLFPNKRCRHICVRPILLTALDQLPNKTQIFYSSLVEAARCCNTPSFITDVTLVIPPSQGLTKVTSLQTTF
jgi:hypothetical protein